MKLLLRILILQLVGAAAVAGVSPPQAEKQPDVNWVVLITIDTLRADHLPAWGAAGIATPHLDTLAGKSVVFSRAATPAPLTLPAHASLFSATYPHFHGIRDNSGYRLPEGIATLAEHLKKSGYSTAAFLGSAVLDRHFGLDRGFDYYGDRFETSDLLRGVAAERRASAVIDEVLGWMERNDPRRLFLWIHLYDPHSPYEAPGEFSGRGYRGEIEYVDRQLGRLFESLARRQRLDSSLIAVLSDHGEDLNQHGEPTHGFFLYETVLHVPLLIKFPDNRFAGKTVDQPVQIIDVAPTLLQALRLPRLEQAQGRGLLGLLRGTPVTPPVAYAETLYPRLHFGWSPLYALTAGRHKYIDAPRPELYDLTKDPAEKENLYDKERALANQLRDQLQTVRTRFRSELDPKPAAVDPALRERLQSLGYATLSRPHDVGLEPSGADPKDKVEIYAEIYRGMEAYTQAELADARSHFEAAIRQDPGVPLAHDYLGSTFLALGDPKAAIDAYKKATELAPERAAINLNLAFAYLEAGRLDAAQSGFELVTQLAPEDWQAWQLLGVTHTRQGRTEEAAEAFEEVLQRSPDHREALFNLGSIYEGQRKFLMAVEVFRRLTQVAPGFAAAWNSLATNYQYAGLGESAEKAFQRAIELDLQYAEALYNYGNLMAQRGLAERAEQLYRQAVRADPEFALAYHNLGVVLEILGRAAEAAEAQATYERLSKQAKP